MDIYGLLGYPLQHSFSSKFFFEKFNREGISAKYLNFEIEDISSITNIIQSNPNLKGLNVTIPHKESVIKYLNVLDESANSVGAVNVIKIERTSETIRLIGYNTDVIGFQKSIEPLLDINKHHSALILGTGGASKAVAKGLGNLGLKYQFVSRKTIDRGYTYETLSSDIINENKVIINASPLGTFPKVDSCADIPYQYLTENHLLYDLVYNPEKTLFMQKGERQGASIKNGLEMLIVQAQEAWNIWNNK